MTTVYYLAASLDGFVADADNSLQWLLRLDDGSASEDGFVESVGALAMGSTTYEWLLEHQIGAGKPWPHPQPTWVFTHQPRRAVPGADIRFTRAPIPSVHRELAAAAGNKPIWIVGGGDLAGQFQDHHLLDEIIVTVAPVTLGSGSPLMPRRIDWPPLELVSVARHGAFAQLHYRVPRPA